MMDALRNHDAPPLRADLLAAGNMIDVPVCRRPTWPERAMRWVWRGFWAAFLLVLAIMIPMVAMVLS